MRLPLPRTTRCYNRGMREGRAPGCPSRERTPPLPARYPLDPGPMTGPTTVRVRVDRYGVETQLRHDGNGCDVYDLTSEDRHTGETSLIGHIIPVAEGHEALRARGELESVRLGTRSANVSNGLTGPLSQRWQQRLGYDIDWLHATVGQMNERRSLGTGRTHRPPSRRRGPQPLPGSERPRRPSLAARGPEQ